MWHEEQVCEKNRKKGGAMSPGDHVVNSEFVTQMREADIAMAVGEGECLL